MLDHVKATTPIDTARFTPDALAATGRAWQHMRTTATETGLVQRHKATYSSTDDAPKQPHRLTATVNFKQMHLAVEVTLPRMLYGDNWHTLAEADIPVACEQVDDHLVQCLGALATDLPPFSTWAIREAEYPHDIVMPTPGDVERWLTILSTRPLKGAHKYNAMPRPYPTADGGYSGLKWGRQTSERSITAYDKSRQSADPQCPQSLLRLETCVRGQAWSKLLSPEACAAGQVMTVAEAGTIRVAAQVLTKTYDDLSLANVASLNTPNPFLHLKQYYGEQQARTLAGFYAFVLTFGQEDARNVYGRMFTGHRNKLVQAGLGLPSTAMMPTTALPANLPPIPRPTAAYLAQRPVFDVAIPLVWCKSLHLDGLLHANVRWVSKAA